MRSFQLPLLSCVGKLLERITYKKLTWHLESNSVLAQTHTGYLLFRNTEDQLALWVQDIQYAFQEMVDRMISRQVKLREGVPQGHVVSPTVFLVYINGITTTVPRQMSKTLHADHFAVWCAEEYTTTAVHHTQNTINEVCS